MHDVFDNQCLSEWTDLLLGHSYRASPESDQKGEVCFSDKM